MLNESKGKRKQHSTNKSHNESNIVRQTQRLKKHNGGVFQPGAQSQTMGDIISASPSPENRRNYKDIRFSGSGGMFSLFLRQRSRKTPQSIFLHHPSFFYLLSSLTLHSSPTQPPKNTIKTTHPPTTPLKHPSKTPSSPTHIPPTLHSHLISPYPLSIYPHTPHILQYLLTLISLPK